MRIENARALSSSSSRVYVSPTSWFRPLSSPRRCCARSHRGTTITAALAQPTAAPTSREVVRRREASKIYDTLWALGQGLPFLFPAFSIAASLSYLKVLPLTDVQTTACLVLPPLLLHVIGPALDTLIGELPPATQEAGQQSFWTRLMPLLYCVPQLAAQLLAVTAAGHVYTTVGSAGLPQTLMLALCTGFSCAVGFSSSHELIHSRHPLHQAAAAQQLAWSQLWVYSRAHHHHHKHIATPEDPTCGDKGESFYAFVPKYLSGSYRIAWELESSEAQRRGRAVWSVHNRMVQGMIMQAAWLCVSYALGGWAGVGLHVVSATVGSTYLLALDYCLHYGLRRHRTASGAYEPLSERFSWNSGLFFENSFLYRVLMHSDHHTVGSKPYNRLGFTPTTHTTTSTPTEDNTVSASHAHTHDTAPRMVPMLLLSLAVFVPPLWYSIADPLVDRAMAEAAAERDGSKALA